MYVIRQSFPDEKIVFASESVNEATTYFNLQLQHGRGWYELWDENTDMPMRSGGQDFSSSIFSPTEIGCSGLI